MEFVREDNKEFGEARERSNDPLDEDLILDELEVAQW